MNPYYYLYYAIYSLLQRLNYILKNTIIEYSTMLLVSILVFLNIITIASVIEVNSSIAYFEGEIKAKALGITIIIINYLIFNHKKRYKKIVQEYSKKDSSVGGVFVLFYIVLTVWLFFHFGGEVRELRMSK